MARPTQNDPLIHQHIIADLRRFADDYTHPVVDEEAPADPCPRVDLNTGEEAIHMREQASSEMKPVPPQEMGDAMKPQGVQSRIAEDDLYDTPCCRVFGKNSPHILCKDAKGIGHLRYLPNTYSTYHYLIG